jgi:hypothetical protein
MRRLAPAAVALLAGLLSACVGYPRPYLTTLKGKADLGEDGKPVKLAAAIVKECETWQGETEKRGSMHETMTDKDGRYSITVMGVAWNFKNLVTEGECRSHVQMFACRPYCKKVDQVDVDVLGK